MDKPLLMVFVVGVLPRLITGQGEGVVCCGFKGLGEVLGGVVLVCWADLKRG